MLGSFHLHPITWALKNCFGRKYNSIQSFYYEKSQGADLGQYLYLGLAGGRMKPLDRKGIAGDVGRKAEEPTGSEIKVLPGGN